MPLPLASSCAFAVLLVAIPAGAAPILTVNRQMIAFGAQRVGTISSAIDLIITNTGDSDLLLSGLTSGGNDPGDFSTDVSQLPHMVNGAWVIPPGGMVTLPVRFSPKARGMRSASLGIYSSVGNQDVLFTGDGTFCMLSVAPGHLDFGMVQVNGPPGMQTLRVINQGTATCNITAANIDGPQGNWFRPAALLKLPIAVLPLGGVDLDVLALAFAGGPAMGELHLITDDPMAPMFTVPLSANSTPGIASVDPPNLDFGNVALQRTTAMTLTVSNQGGTPLSVLDFKLVDVGGSFDAGAGIAPKTGIAPGGSTMVQILFHPLGVGAAHAEVDITTDDAQHPFIRVPLDGAGVDGSCFKVTPAMVQVGTTLPGAVADFTLTLDNGCAFDLPVKSIVPDANRFAFNDPGPFTLKALDKRAIPVTFVAPDIDVVYSHRMTVQVSGFPPAMTVVSGEVRTPIVAPPPDLGPPPVDEAAPANIGSCALGGRRSSTTIPVLFALAGLVAARRRVNRRLRRHFEIDDE